MALKSFDARQFQAKTAAMINHANSIIAEYQARGFTPTLRQVFYQFVVRSPIDNEQSEYKRLGVVIKNGRRGGLIDWDAIEDRTRNLQRPSSWEDPPDRRDMLGSTHAFDSRARPLGVFETKEPEPKDRLLRRGSRWRLVRRSRALVAAARSEPLQGRRRPRRPCASSSEGTRRHAPRRGPRRPGSRGGRHERRLPLLSTIRIRGRRGEADDHDDLPDAA